MKVCVARGCSRPRSLPWDRCPRHATPEAKRWARSQPGAVSIYSCPLCAEAMRVAFVDPPWLHYECVADRRAHQATLHVKEMPI